MLFSYLKVPGDSVFTTEIEEESEGVNDASASHYDGQQ